MRLGFSVRVLGKPGLRGYDGRRAANSPHLSVSLAHLRDVLSYLEASHIGMYRMAPDLAPYATHPDWPELHHQIDDCLPELEEIGSVARQIGIRLSFHAPSHVALGSCDSVVVERSTALLHVLTGLLDAMGQPDEAVIVCHSGGLAGGPELLIGRWVRVWERLPPAIRRRLVLEHEAEGLTLPDALRIHAATGTPIVFDYLHFRLNNPEGWSLRAALAEALRTWPDHVRPKAHFSSPRTELRVERRRDERGGRPHWSVSPPRPGHHADFANPWEFEGFVRTAEGLRDFDVLLEAKAGDLAVLRLREDLARYAAGVCSLLHPDERSL
jgi:UV DNA damage endonuclease